MAANNDNTSQPPAPEPAARQANSAGIWVAMVLLLLLILALAGYQWWSDDRQQQAIAAQHDALQTMQRTVQQSIQQTLQQQLDQQTGRTQQFQHDTQQQLTSMQQQLRNQQQQIASLSTADRSDWLLAEAEYLIRLANQRLLLSGSLVGTSDLLNAADDILKQLNDITLYPVRRALAQEIAALDTAKKVDIEGLYFQLATSAEQAAELPLLRYADSDDASATPATAADATTATESTATDNDDTWQQWLHGMFALTTEKLRASVQIQHRDDKYQPDLSPEYAAVLRQNVQLMFIQAQMALLSGKQWLYQSSLQQVIDWLQTYYNGNLGATNALIERIDTLQQHKITVVLPDISQSLKILQAIMHGMDIGQQETGGQETGNGEQETGNGEQQKENDQGIISDETSTN